MSNFSANNFKLAPKTHTQELIEILAGFVKCYQVMIDNKIVVANNENIIRDKFLSKEYGLKNTQFKKEVGLTSYFFDKETSEDSGGIADIRVLSQNSFSDDNAYYLIECKRLDNTNTKGVSGLNAEYIKNGIMRFTSNWYSTYYELNGMIGFVVEEMNIDNNVNDINQLLLNPKFNDANTVENLISQENLSDFPYYYQSKHEDSKKEKINIHHLMFDFSNNIDLK